MYLLLNAYSHGSSILCFKLSFLLLFNWFSLVSRHLIAFLLFAFLFFSLFYSWQPMLFGGGQEGGRRAGKPHLYAPFPLSSTIQYIACTQDTLYCASWILYAASYHHIISVIIFILIFTSIPSFLPQIISSSLFFHHIISPSLSPSFPLSHHLTLPLGTENVALIAGLGAASQLAYDESDALLVHMLHLKLKLILLLKDKLSTIKAW